MYMQNEVVVGWLVWFGYSLSAYQFEAIAAQPSVRLTMK